VSESGPRLLLYPQFLSEAECDHLLDLAKWGAMEAAAMAGLVAAGPQIMSWDGNRPVKAAASGQTVSIHLPSRGDDPLIQSIEERIAAVTAIPIHPDEEPLGIRHTSPSTAAEFGERCCTALHVDTNQGGTYRCATVLLYVQDIEIGGETRFPVVGADEHSDLRAAAKRLADMGTTAFSPSETVEWPPLALRKTLLDAAEDETVGLHVKPRKGLAAVFWTHLHDGLDPYSWHTGARLPPEATEGKTLVQKFKSMPRQYRPTARGARLCLPAELAPPAV